MQSLSRKHKLNTRISTEAELVVVIDSSVSFFGRCYLLNEKGTILTKNIFYQDKKSTIMLEVNGKSSAGNRSRALNIN